MNPCRFSATQLSVVMLALASVLFNGCSSDTRESRASAEGGSKQQAEESKQSEKPAALGDLVRASADGDLKRVAALLDAGAGVNENVGTETDQLTPLVAATTKGHAEIVALLLKRGAATHPTYKGYSAK